MPAGSRCRICGPPGERVEIPYEGKKLAGILRKPRRRRRSRRWW